MTKEGGELKAQIDQYLIFIDNPEELKVILQLAESIYLKKFPVSKADEFLFVPSGKLNLLKDQQPNR